MNERFRAQLGLTHDVHAEQDAVTAAFLERALAAGLSEIKLDNWPTAESSLAALGPPLLRVTHQAGASALFEVDGVLLHVGLWGSHVHATAAANDTAAIEASFALLRELFRPPDPTSSHDVPVTFWTYSPHGPQPSWRSIGVPSWDEIRDNYSLRTRAGLERMMRGFTPAHGGQLILWHGAAGTGKTFALRGLAWEWREWCQFHYIVDPDSFFGQHADYLMSVLMQPAFPMMVAHGGHVAHMGMSGFAIDDEDLEAEDNRQWRVLVLEDTGELLTADARTVIGQGLSRFLNVVDGLIGQGLRVLVLVTTNEEIRKLHPAVARPGRCAANIEFFPLAADEASAWLERHGLEGEARAPRTLASLYAQLEGRDPSEELLVGFAG